MSSTSKNQKNLASARLMNALTSLIVLAIIGAVIYFVAGPVFRFLIGLITGITVFFAAVICVLGLTSKRNVKSPYKSYREQYYSLVGKKIEEVKTEEEVKDAEGSVSLFVLGISFLTGAVWAAPIMLGLNTRFQIFPLYFFPIVMIAINLISWGKSTLNSMKNVSPENIDKAIADENKSLTHFVLEKAWYLLNLAYYAGVVAVIFGVLK